MKRRLLNGLLSVVCVGLLTLAAISALAQSPIINSFSPASGPVSTTVTLSGQNFDAVSSNNAVFFGSARANVISVVGTTTLNVSVPYGADYRNISVVNLTTGLAGYSNQPFVPTHTTNSDGSVRPPTTLFSSSNSAPGRSVDAGDLNADGKADLVIANADNTVAILVNQITSSISQPNFGSAIILGSPSGSVSASLSLGDIDGDGRLDIIVVFSGSNVVTVYRNTTLTPGASPSFASAATFMVGNSPVALNWGDLDADGKPDVVVACDLASNNIYVLHNASTLGAISFTSGQVFSAGSNPSGVAIGNIDQDTKPDVAVSNLGSNSISLFRNVSSVGSISLSAPTIVSTGARPAAIVIVDLDGDGLQELVTANAGSDAISAFLNTSSLGSFSFAPSVDYSTGVGSAPSCIALGTILGKGAIDMIVVNPGNSTGALVANVSTLGNIAFGGGAGPVPAIPASVKIMDFNADDRPDIAVSFAVPTSNVGVLLQRIPQTLIVTSTPSLSVDEMFTTSVTTTTPASQGTYQYNINNYTGSAIVDSNGIITGISAGMVTFTVTSYGDTDYADAQVDQLVTINRGTPTLTFTSPDTMQVGDNLTAAVFTSATYGRGGAITFSIAEGSGSATVDENTGFLTAVKAGTVTLTAMSPGDGDYVSATADQLIVITKITPTINITSANNMLMDQALTITINSTANFSSGGPLSYTIIAGTGSATVNQATGVMVATGVGDVTLTVTSLGDSNYYSAETSMLITISGSVPTVVISSTNTLKVDESIQVSLSSTASQDIGPLNYSILNGIGSAIVDGNGLITGVSVGDITLTVSSPGNANYQPFSIDQYIIVNKNTPTLSFLSPDNALIGDIINVVVITSATYGRGGTITYTLVAGSGSATLDTNTNELTTRGAGTVILMAYAPGDLDYNASFGSQTITIGRVTPTLALIAPNNVAVDQSFTSSITTTASITSGGNVSFSVVAGSGSATVNPVTGLFTALSIGTVTLTANAAGDTNYYPTSVSKLVTIGKATPTLTINAPATLIQSESATISVNITAGAGRGGAITFGVVAGSGSATINPITGLLVPVSLGTITVTASSAGDTNYLAASTSVLLTIVNSSTPPSITLVSPLSGPIGSSIVIYGQNFSNNPTNNVVYFGGVKATVTGASVSALTVTVPSGASYRYISVTRLNANSTAYSPKPFIVTFKSSGSFDFASDGTTTVSGALVTSRMALGDLNGDGKPDLIVIDNNAGTNANTSSAQPGNSNVYVFLNTSTSSGLISYSLNNTLSLPFNNGPSYTSNHATSYAASFAMDPAATDGSNNVSGISLADIDGDGKQDVVITFKNEKITGNTVNYSGSCSGMTVYITTYSTYKLAAFRNTTSNGSLSLSFGPSSLATFEGATDNAIVQQGSANVNGNGFCDPFSPGSSGGNGRSIRSWYSQTSPVTPNYLPYGRNITVADFDGDGKPDVAIAKELTNTVSIYRNISSSTTLIFATSQIFQVGSNSSYDLAAGDLDNDGKTDLIVANTGLASVSILKNQSTPGTLSLNAVATLNVGTNPQALALGDFDGDGKLDIAVANNGANSLSLFRNTNSMTGTISFPGTASITIPTNSNPSGLALADMDGDGKVDLAVENTGASTVQLFKNTSVGSSLSFTNGSNYNTGSSPQGIVIGDMNADGRPDLAVTNANTGVSFLRNVGTFAPKIVSFSPTSGPVSTSVTIMGSGFNSTANRNVVFFGATQATVTGASSSSLTVSAPYGSNYQYISVTNLDYNTTAYSAKPFVITFPSITLTEVVLGGTITSTSDPQHVSLGDLNGDGKPDMVVANHISSGSTANVYLNTSTSSNVPSFSFGQALSPGQNFVGASVLKDIDGDGKLDITLTAYNNGQVAVYRNLTVLGSASLTFAPVYSLLPSGGARYVTVDDFDGDGRPDIAVSGDATGNTPTAVSVFRNLSSSGTISFGGLQVFGSATGYCLASGDLDNDGKSDIVVTHIVSGTALIFHNISTAGAISFTNVATLTGLSNPVGVVIGDFDQDNKPDLAIANSGGSTVSFFLNTNSVSGTISFNTTASLSFSLSSNPIMLSVGDLNGDGKIDLAIAHTSGSTSLITNLSSVGSLSFTTLKNITTGSNTYGVVVGDLNSDGLPDVVATANGASRISILTSFAIIPVKVTSFSPAAGPISTSVTISGSNFNTTLSKNVVFFGSTRATVTGATSTSLTVIVPYGASYQYISVTNLDYNTTGYSAKPFGVTFPNAPASLSVGGTFSTPGGNPRMMAIGDLNADGRTDFIVANDGASNVSVYLNNSTIAGGSLSFVLATNIPANGARPQGVAIGDIDGDGMFDIAVADYNNSALRLFKNTTTPGSANFSFTTGPVLSTVNQPWYVAFGDFDGDGRPDLVSSDISGSNNQLSVFRNLSSSGTINFASRQTYTVGARPVVVTVGDLDQDGKVDIVVACETPNAIYMLHNTSVIGAISFASATSTGGALNQPRGIALGDFNSDGKTDIAVSNAGGNSVSFYLNTNSSSGTLSFPGTPTLTIGTASEPVWIASTDMDGNGKIDLVVAEATGNSVAVLTNASITGSLSFTYKNYGAGTRPENLVVCDMNNDGFPDIIAANFTSGNLSILAFQKLSQTITITSPNIAYGGSLTASATTTAVGGAGGAILFSLQAGSGSATIDPNTGAIHMVQAGTLTLTASTAGDTNYLPASASQLLSLYYSLAGVDTGIKIWLRADAGVSTSGSNVSRWDDQSGNITNTLNQATPVGGPSSDIALNSSGMNYNPVLTFSGASGKELIGTSLIPFAGTSTVIAVARNVGTNLGGVFVTRTAPAGNGGPGIATSLSNNTGGYSLDANGYVSSETPANASPAILVGQYSNTYSGVMYMNGISYVNNLGSIGPANATSASTNFEVGGRTVGNINNRILAGDIAEVAFFDHPLTATERTRIQSYLAIKYGIALDAVAEPDYLASDGSVIWQGSNNSGYDNARLAIGVDNASGLYQRQSRSTSGMDILSFGIGSITLSNSINGGSFTADKSFLIVGNNGALTGSSTSTDVPSNVQLNTNIGTRASRVWKVQNTGNVGALELQFDLTGAFSGTVFNTNNLALLIDKNGSPAGFADETVAGGGVALSSTQVGGVSSSIYKFGGITLNSGDRFTVGLIQNIPLLTITSASTMTTGSTLTATVSTTANSGMGGAITYSITAGSGSATVNPITGAVLATRIGTVTLTATSAGDASYSSATTSQLITISKGTPSLIITGANMLVLGQSTMTTFVTSAVGGGTITYSKIDGNPGSIDLDAVTGAFTATQPGSVTLTVVMAGTNDYYAATASQLIVIARATPTLSFLSPSAMGVGDSLTVSITSTATNGRGGAITYNIIGGSGSATVNPTTGLLKAVSQGTITLTATSVGDTYYTSATVSQLIVIGRGAQTLTITSSNMIPYLGTLTATVSTTASNGRGGAITYSIILGSGSATVNPNTGFITTMGAGTFTLIAYAAGDSDYLSASTSQEITIQTGVQSLTITSATTMFVDEALTATITRSLVGGAGGPIVYSIMAGSGSASVDANSGVVKAIGAGTVSLTAEATGDANYGPASTTIVINIIKISQTLTITGPLVMRVDDLTPTTVVTTATGGRGGSYIYTITNGTGLADVDVGGSVLAIVVGQVTLTVTTLGDSNYYGASTSVAINIIKSSPTLTVISGNQVLVDEALTTTVFTTATFARGGALTYSLVAGSGSATVNALGVVRGVDVGTVTLFVSSAGDANYYPGSTSHTITVNRSTPTLVVSSANALPAGTSLTVSLSTSANGRDIGVLSYSVSAGSGSATVNSNGLLTAIAGGTVVLTVNSAGNANYYPGVGMQTVTIGRVTPTLTVSSSNIMVVGEALTVSVLSTAASGLGGAYSFSISGGSGSATVNPSTGVITAISAGMITLTVNSAGDTSYYPTSTTQLITINGGAQTLTVTSANTVTVDGLLNVSVNTTATGGRGGAFSYIIQNGTGSAIVSPEGVITGISVGTVTLTVSAAGDNDYSPASIDQTITVMKATPTLTVTSSPAILVNTTLSTTVNSSATFGRGGSLSYSIINGSGMATVDANGVISATQIGSITLMVSSSGDADYYPATITQDIMVVSVALSNLSAVSEGHSLSVLLSLVPSTALLNTPITIAINANSSSTANPAHYSVPSQVFFPAGQNSVSIPFTALNDNILYNDEVVMLDFSSPEIGTLTGAITITDATSLDPNNLFITIGNAIIHQDETVSVTVSLPDGVTSLVPIDVTLSVSQASVLHLSSYTLPTTVTIAAGSNSATFDVSATTNDIETSILIIDGSAISSLTTSTGIISVTYTVRSGIVLVSGQQLSINQAYHRGDPFEISGLAKYPDNTVRVFNVLSNGVFELANYDNQSRVFRGYGPQGEILPEGNYYVAVFYYDDKGNPHTYVNFFYLK